MKKSIAIVLTLIMALATISGCAGGSGSNSGAESAGNSSADGSVSADGANADYPANVIQVIVPYSPGGGSDTLARAAIAASDLPMVAINIEGASGLVGTMQAYESKPDGYTIVVQTTHDLMGFTVSGNTDVRMFEDMPAICELVTDYNAISTNKKTGWTTIEDMVEYVKAHPGEVNWGVTGAQGMDFATTTMHLQDLGIADAVNIVPYEGGSEGMTALLGNHVQVSTLTIGEQAGGIASGDIVPLLISSPDRVEAYPDVPTTKETGLRWYGKANRGFFAPPGTPEDILKILQDNFEKVSRDETFKQAMIDYGFTPIFDIGANVDAYMTEAEPMLADVYERLAAINRE
ncbi:MAG: tripartite tricarboxylate transporter substrate binding protein [Clostridiales Family XIII bacterium]|jgi:tripartite-type tricarboxylate transporter receptor subunit TctC|nr:tripartite tricarboxylate transporter substrate binding protein [Clostridiales Family XIII bacterium]